YHCEVRTS
ncbi:unnamed protein product, partial [Allacma fusca]